MVTLGARLPRRTDVGQRSQRHSRPTLAKAAAYDGRIADGQNDGGSEHPRVDLPSATLFARAQLVICSARMAPISLRAIFLFSNTISYLNLNHV